MDESSVGCSSGKPSGLVIVLLHVHSIIKEQNNSNEFDLEMKGFSFSKDVLEDIKNNNFQVIYALAEQALLRQLMHTL